MGGLYLRGGGGGGEFNESSSRFGGPGKIDRERGETGGQIGRQTDRNRERVGGGGGRGREIKKERKEGVREGEDYLERTVRVEMVFRTRKEMGRETACSRDETNGIDKKKGGGEIDR